MNVRIVIIISLNDVIKNAVLSCKEYYNKRYLEKLIKKELEQEKKDKKKQKMIQTINKNKYKITVDCGKVNGKRISRIFNGNKKDAKILEPDLKKQIMSNDTSFIKK